MSVSTNQNISNNSLWLLIALCLPVTISCIDLMAVSVAIDNVMHEFSVTVSKTQWLLSGYTIGTASFLITIGRLADIYGRRRLLFLGVFSFGLSSLIAAIANNIDVLIISRFVQGIAGSVMMTTVISIITHHFSPKERGSVITKWGFSLGMGLAIGPLIGGSLIYLLNWRAIFAVNIPICFLAYILIIRFVPESKDETSRLKIDWFEAILLTFAMLSLVTVLSQGGIWGWGSNYSLGCITVFMLSTIVFIFMERHKKDPLIDPHLFMLTNFSVSTLCGFISYFCMYAWLFIFSVYLQNTRSMSPLKAGVVLSAFSIAFAFNSKMLGKILNQISNIFLMQIGFIMGTFVFLWMAMITPQTNVWKLIIMFFVVGTAITIVNAPSILSATENVPASKTGVASGTLFTIRWLGGSIGIVVITIIYQLGLSAACLAMAIAALLGFFCTFALKRKV